MASNEPSKALSAKATDPRGSAVLAARKQAAAEAAALQVQSGMAVGLGTGSTVAKLLPALAARKLAHLRCVPTSPATAAAARKLGLPLVTLADVQGSLDIAIDGADQVDPEGWLIKGGGGAHTREKVVAAAARKFVVIVSSEKLVSALSAPVPLEVLRFAAPAVLRRLAPAKPRDAPLTPDGNLLLDYLGAIDDKRELAARLASVPGVVGHGIFSNELVSEVLIGGQDGVRALAGAKGQAACWQASAAGK